MPKPISPEIKAQALAEHAKAPHDTDDIAARHGIARSTLVKWTAAAKNPPTPKQKRTEKVLDKSPKALKDSDGEWVRDAHWHPFAGRS